MTNSKIYEFFISDFEKIKNKKHLIKNPLFFSDDFIPNEIKFREEQKNKIIFSTSYFIKGVKNNNLFLIGATGTGKTLLMKYISKGLSIYLMKEKYKTEIVYVNCKMINSKEKDYYILLKIYEKLLNNKLKTGLKRIDILEGIRRFLNDEGYKIILILDEGDFLFKDNPDFLYDLLRNEEQSDQKNIMSIIISNNVSFLDNIDQRIRSSLSSVMKIKFPPYDSLQLFEILKERAINGLTEGSINEELLKYISAKVAKEFGGDARVAINILKNSALIAESKGKEKIEKEDIEESIENADFNIISTILDILNRNQKIILLSLLLKQADKKDFVSTEELYEEYLKLSEKLGDKPLDYNTVYKYMKTIELVLGNYIEVYSVSKGKNGLKKIYRILIDEGKIIKIIKEIEKDI